MPAPHHRHQTSLEGIVDFSSTPSLDAALRERASRKLITICNKFDEDIPAASFSPPRLIHYTYENSLSPESGDRFLRAFYQAIDSPIDGNELVNLEDVRSKFFDFADYLFNNFFLPMKASTKQTPQPTPALYSAVRRVQGRDAGRESVGTLNRISTLRRDCLLRDHHRCVISRRFDYEEMTLREKTNPSDAKDDEGNLLESDDLGPVSLEVAHILPHSLTKLNTAGELDAGKRAAIAILDMFDIGVAELIQGPEIDRPHNALTLTKELHERFGSFQLFFEPAPGRDHTYTITTLRPRHHIRDPRLPVIRELFLTPERTIEPPSPRLLAIHRAISRILHMSGAGDYIDEIFRDMEEFGIQEDGSTPLGRLVSLAIEVAKGYEPLAAILAEQD